MHQADTILNLVWVLFCIAAGVYFAVSEVRAARRSSVRPLISERVRRGVALFIAAVSLFPCVSASDDSVRFEYLGLQQSAPVPGHAPGEHSRKPLDEKNLGTLIRLLEALESVQVFVALQLAFVLLFFAFITAEGAHGVDRRLPRRSGRAPPQFLSFA